MKIEWDLRLQSLWSDSFIGLSVPFLRGQNIYKAKQNKSLLVHELKTDNIM